MADTPSLTGTEKLEQHLYELCAEMDADEFRELAGPSEHWDIDLLPKLLEYHHGDRSRRPLGQKKVLELRDVILDNLDAKESAMDNHETIELGKVLTEAQLEKAKEIVAEDGPRTRDLLVREVLTMDPPAGIAVERDEHDRIKQYGPFLPAYLAYGIIYAVNKSS